MNIDKTELLPIVDPVQLEAGYNAVSHLIEASFSAAPIAAGNVLERLDVSFPKLDATDLLDLFRRVVLTVQLVSEVDANWADMIQSYPRPDPLPFSFFELAATELAFEGVTDGSASTFFGRDVLSDAIMAAQSI